MREVGLSLSPYHQEPSSSYTHPPTCHQVPLPEEIQVSPGDTEIHRVEPEDVANHLTAFHWELFRCVHEVRQKLVLGLECAPRSLFSGAGAPSWKAHTWALHSHNLSRTLSLQSGKMVENLFSRVFWGPSAASVDSESEFIRVKIH